MDGVANQILGVVYSGGAGGWGYGQQAFRDILPGAVFFPFRASGNGDGGENAEEEEEEDRRDASSGG